MKFLIAASVYLPSNGGVERYVSNVSSRLVKSGNEVTVVAMNTHGAPEYENMDGVEVYRLPCKNLLGGRYPIPVKNGDYKKIFSAIEQKEFDIVIINARFYVFSLVAARFAKRRGIKCITIEHGSSHLSVNNKLLDFCGAVYEHIFTAVLKRYCKDYYGVSKVANEWSAHFGIKSKGVLYNAVDAAALKELTDNPAFDYRKEYGIGQDDNLIVFTGRILKEKGVFELLNAYKNLEGNNTYLFFAGDGPALEELKQKSDSERVIFLGNIELKNVMALLKTADVFCLPSVSEGMSTSVLEAVAAKCFVITTRQGGAKELITDKSFGIIIDDNKPESICKALKTALFDKEYRLSACEKSYNRLLDGFTWEKTAEEIEKVAEVEK